MKFPFGATRVKEILELIHCDFFGPVPVPLLGGYFVGNNGNKVVIMTIRV